MKNEDYVILKVAKKLSEKGFDWPVHSMYGKVYIVRDEIKEAYKGLSDDGYYDLLEENGGHLKEDEVYGEYIEPLNCLCRNTFSFFNEYPRMICSRPSLYEAQKWLREIHNIDVLPVIREESHRKDYCCYIYKNAKVVSCKVAYGEDFYECMNDSLIEALKYI